jgi:hypothetical protein
VKEPNPFFTFAKTSRYVFGQKMENIYPRHGKVPFDSLLEVAKWLKAEGNDIDEIKDGNSPIFSSDSYSAEITEILLLAGADACQVSAEGHSLSSVFRRKFEKPSVSVLESHLQMLLRNGFDVGLLRADDLPKGMQQAVRGQILKNNILRFNAYAKLYNKCNKKHPVKVKDAQSMIQVMYKDVSTYLPYGIVDE